MKNNTTIIVFASLGILSFIIPWIRLPFLGSASLYDMLRLSADQGYDKGMLLILYPVLFLLIIVLRSIRQVPTLLMKSVEALPFLLWSYIFIQIFLTFGIDFEQLIRSGDDLLRLFLDVVLIGLPLSLLASVGVLFGPIRPSTYSTSSIKFTNSFKEYNQQVADKFIQSLNNTQSTSKATKGSEVEDFSSTEKEKNVAPPKSQKLCLSCLKVYSLDDNFCEECGEQLKKVT